MPRLLAGLPGLSVRVARLLTLGDVDGRHAHGVVDHGTAHRLQDVQDGRRVVCAIATGAANRGWTLTELWEALAERPSPGGAWLREVRGRRGEGYARDKLAGIWASARRLVAASPAHGSRGDAGGELAELRDLVAGHPWTGRAGATDQRVLIAHLVEAERAGGREHSVSVRQTAERAGVAVSTVQAARRRLAGTWLVAVRVPVPAEGEQTATVWRWRRPPEILAALAAAGPVGNGATETAVQGLLALPGMDHTPEPGGQEQPGRLVDVSGHPPGPPPRQVRGVPETRIVQALMGHDACHGHALGSVGLRILAGLTPEEGRDAAELAEAVGVSTATVHRRVRQLIGAGLVERVDGQLYHHPDLLDALTTSIDTFREQQEKGWAPAEVDELSDRLTRLAQALGTHGAGARRAVRHVIDRRRRRTDLTRLSEHRRPPLEPGPLVGPEHIDPVSGAGLGEMTGWDCTDPWRPTWRDEPGTGLTIAA